MDLYIYIQICERQAIWKGEREIISSLQQFNFGIPIKAGVGAATETIIIIILQLIANVGI